MATATLNACGMQDLLGRRMSREGFVNIIYTSDFYPSSGIAANRDVTPDVIRALLDFKPLGVHAEGLYHWNRTEMAKGFIEARDKDYAGMREWIIKLGLLDNPVKGEVR